MIRDNTGSSLKQSIRRRTINSLMAALLSLPLLAFAYNPLQDDGVIIKGEKGSEATDVREGQERYGPITSSDTLWAIAKQYRPHSSVTQYQTMVAIAQANPRAFVNGNINRMLDGFYLRIPSLQEIDMINPETARRRVLADEQLKQSEQQLSEAEQQTQQTREQQQQLLKEARQRAEQVIKDVEQQQQQSFSQLRGEVNESMQAVQRVYDENEAIQQRLDLLAERIEELATGLQKSSQLEQEFDQLLQQQQQLMEMQQQEQVQEKSSGFMDWLKNPLNLTLLAILPALIVIFVLYWLFIRRKPESDDEPAAEKKVDELDDEEASKALDRELMEGGADNADDGLFDLDGDNDDDEDLGDDLSALEAELTQTGQSQQDDDDFSIRLDDDEEEEGDDSNEAQSSEPAASEQETSEPEPVDEELLPEDDKLTDTDASDDEQEGDSELSQEELDRLFAETDDDDAPALDLSLDDEDEAASEPQTESEPEQEPEPESEPEPEPEPESEPEPEKEPEKAQFEDPDAAEETLAQLGIEEDAVDEEDDSEATDSNELDRMLQESEQLESELSDLDDIEEELPEDDEALEQAEQQADSELDQMFSEPEQTSTEEKEDGDEGGYLDIDSLMEDAEEGEEEQDNYQSSAVGDLLNDEELENISDSDESSVDEEASGQLDLARAYIDMGEADEAKEILQQLIDGNDDKVAEEAKSLLKRLDS